MTTETVSEQGALEARDVPTSQEGQLESSASSIPPAPPEELKEEPAETKDSAKPQNDEAKKTRKSDKEWQETKEKAQKVDTLQTRVEQLEEVTKRKDWELDHPIVRDERYREAWDQVNSEERFKTLTYDERWKLVSKEDSTQISREVTDQLRKSEGSVPPSSRSVPTKKGLDADTLEMAKNWGNKPEDFEKYGVL